GRPGFTTSWRDRAFGRGGGEMNALPRLKQTRAGWEGSKKENPARRAGLSFPPYSPRENFPKEMGKRGGTRGTKTERHQISVRNRTRYSLEKTSSLNVVLAS